MAAYRFEALDAAGKTITGLVDADNPKTARAQLRVQHLVPLKVDAVVAAGETQGQNKTMFSGRVFNPSALSIWTRQLSGLVVAGLPLERALTDRVPAVTRAAAWTIDKLDPIGNRQGAPGFIADAEFGAYKPEAYERLLLDAIALQRPAGLEAVIIAA